MRVQIVSAFLLGVIAAFLGTLVLGQRPEPVLAQNALGGGGMIAVGGNSEPGGRNFLWVVDSKTDTPHLALYEWEGNRLVLQASRNIKFDLEFDQFPGGANAHKPTVADAYKEVEKAKKQK